MKKNVIIITLLSCAALFGAVVAGDFLVEGSLIFEGATADAFETTISAADPTADRTWTIPDISDTFAGLAGAQTFATGTKTVTSKFDFGGGTLEIPNGTTLPATCAVGDGYMDTDATTGQRWYLCESANTWALQGGAGGTTPPLTLFRQTFGEHNGTTYSGYICNGCYTASVAATGSGASFLFGGGVVFNDSAGEILYVQLGVVPSGYDVASINFTSTIQKRETSTATMIFKYSVACQTPDTSETSTALASLTYSTATSATTTPSTSTVNLGYTNAAAGHDGTTNATGCAVGDIMTAKIERDNTDTNAVDIWMGSLEITIDAL